MSASVEAYLARLYLDAGARRAFTADPASADTQACLTEARVAARSLDAGQVPGRPLRARLLDYCRRLLRR